MDRNSGRFEPFKSWSADELHDDLAAERLLKLLCFFASTAAC